MDSDNRKILMIAYHFHPDLEVGAIRSVKFAKFLPESGWRAGVVSVEEDYYEKTDSAPLSVPCTIYRSGKLPTVGNCYLWLKRLLSPSASGSSRPGSAATAAIPESGYFAVGSAPLWKRFINSLSWTPDNHIGWLVPGVWAALKAIRREKPDIIYTSGPPQTGHLIGLIASRLTGRPLVTDFRDPWSTGDKPIVVTTALSKWLERWLERRVIKRASLVVTTTAELRDVLLRMYPVQLAGRCVAIVNGFDAEDFPVDSRPRRDPAQPIKFLYAGTLYQGRDPRAFVVALGELLGAGAIRAQDLSVEFYGAVDIDPRPLQEVIRLSGLSEIVQFRASVKRAAYLELINAADVLILLQSDLNPTQIPAKTFEYLATGNEILAMAAPGATANLLRGYGNVQVVNPNDQGAVKQALKVIIERLRSGASDRGQSRQALKHMHKRELTKELARQLDAVVAEGR